MMGLGTLGQKAVAAIAGVTLVSLAAVGAFASQDFVTIQEETPTVEGTETATATPTDTAEATETPDGEATETPTPTETPVDESTETPEATPEATETPDDGEGEGEGEGEGQREIGGIPEDHPVFTPDDDDVCEKHESRVKTTPSGREVRVPCHAAGGDDSDGARKGNGKNKNSGEDDE